MVDGDQPIELAIPRRGGSPLVSAAQHFREPSCCMRNLGAMPNG
jgi:hypothetical protein